MQTTIKLRASELNERLILGLKKLFDKNENIEITISFLGESVEPDEVTDKEALYKTKIDKSIENIEKGQNMISFTGEEFEALTKKLLGNT